MVMIFIKNKSKFPNYFLKRPALRAVIHVQDSFGVVYRYWGLHRNTATLSR